jgi:thiol-disulfide isomerase/thioredoxin
MSRLVPLFLVALSIVGVAVALATGDEPAAAPKVELKAIKYDALKAAVREQRGKVVVVDVWADFCLPCKKAFPHMLEMQQRYGKDGLVCMSLTVDPPDKRGAALKFLQDKHATIPNYWLDEKESVWQEKFDSGGPPIVFVFDRQGRRAAKFDNNDPDKSFTPDDVEKLVKQLLNEQN